LELSTEISTKSAARERRQRADAWKNSDEGTDSATRETKRSTTTLSPDKISLWAPPAMGAAKQGRGKGRRLGLAWRGEGGKERPKR
jgi:hypothetical protein